MHKSTYISIFLGLFIALFIQCANAPDFTDEPEIEFISISKSSFNQGFFNEDSLILTISFQDGNGDIGNDTTQNIVVIDNRTGDIYDRFVTPQIPEQGINNGVKGEVRMVLFNTCCIFPDGIPPCEIVPQYPTDEISFSIYMEDRAGNQSNTINTSTVTILCN